MTTTTVSNCQIQRHFHQASQTN